MVSNPKTLTRKVEKELIARVEARSPRFPMDANRSVLEARWLRNHHYYNGRSFLVWNESNQRWSDESEWDDPYIANLIRPTILRTVAKVTGAKFVPRTAPETAEASNRAAARLGERALMHLWDSVDFQGITERAATNALVMGTGFYKVFWDKASGPDIRMYTDDSGELLMDAVSREEEMEKEMLGQYKDIKAGDVGITAVSPFSVIPDEDLVDDDMSKCRYITELKLCRRSFLVEMYGETEVKEVSFDDQEEFEMLSEQLKNENSTGTFITESCSQEDDMDPRVLCREYYEAPTMEFPEGLRLVVAGGKILSYGPNIHWKLGLFFPYVPVQYGLDPEKFWKDSLVSQLVPVQEEYNRTRSQIVDNKDRMASPKWLVPKGSELPDGALVGKEGEIVEFNPTVGAPAMSQPAPLPPYVSEHLQHLINEFQIIAADRDPTQAKTPSSLRSGVAIQLLDEKDRDVLSATMSQVKNAIQKVARMAMVMMGELYDEPRLLKVIGEDGDYDVQSFMGADLKRNYDVRIYVESGAGDSRAGRQSAILDYVQLGILDPTNPEDKRSILKALEFGDPQAFVSETIVDERVAERENDQMRNGVEAPVLPWYNHVAHLKVHDAEMKSESFLKLPEQIQQLMIAHRQLHDQEQAKIVEAQLKAEALMRGGAGEKGKASTPSRP